MIYEPEGARSLLMSAPCGDPDAAMNEQGEKPGQKPDGSYGASTEELDVRATMELTRQALEASAAEVERSKRLLRETEDLVDLPVSSHPDNSGD